MLRGAAAAARARTASGSAAPEAAARVRVGREVAGRSGKGVTVISGLPLNPARLDELAARLRSCAVRAAR